MSPALKAKESQEESVKEAPGQPGEEEVTKLIQSALSKLDEGASAARRARGAASRLRSVCTSK